MSEPVAPTPEDLEAFRDRMKAAIADAGTTARALESRLELSRGTFTRIYGGRRQIDEELLRRAADALQADPRSLVQGTAFERLLHPASTPEVEPAPPEPPADAAPPPTAKPPTAPEAERAVPEPPAEETPADEAQPSASAPEPPVEPAAPAEPVAAEAPSPQPPPPASQVQADPSAPRSEERERSPRRLRDVPVRAALAIAGGLALVGGTLAALFRRR